jgi:hypothetical protein
MGIADLGGGPAGAQSDEYWTTAFRGTIDVGAVSSYNGSLSFNPEGMSFQLNAFLVFDIGSSRYAYWMQDVADLNTLTRGIGFEDNIWNATSLNLSSTALSGKGTVSSSGGNSYYGYGAPCVSGGCTTLADPSSVTLELRASLGTGGVPTVRFQYDDTGSFETYDTVTFPFAPSVSNFQGFYVDPGLGFPGDCPRCFGDVELVAGGPGNGSQTSLVGATALLFSLDWWNGNNFEPVPDASDHGEATGEGISSAVDQLSSDPAGEPEAGLSYGSPGPLGPLWSEATTSTIEVSVVGASGGNLSIGGALVPFSSTFVETVVEPGPVNLSLVTNTTTYSLGPYELVAGEALTLEVGGLPLVFMPVGLPNGTVWSVEVGGQPLLGTGNITFGEPTGTYPYVVGPVPGYAAVPASGNVSVEGSGEVVAVDWSSTHSDPWLGLWKELVALAPLWVLLIVLLVAAVAARSLSHRRRSRRPPRPYAPAPVVPMMGPPCPHCGDPVRVGLAACPRCGHRLFGSPPAR